MDFTSYVVTLHAPLPAETQGDSTEMGISESPISAAYSSAYDIFHKSKCVIFREAIFYKNFFHVDLLKNCISANKINLESSINHDD